MPIRVLDPHIANQIAAGEVVDRPASVVKELIENSIDAGATRIEIDIYHGGANRISVWDNGIGIDKDEIGLALSRHTTSKISCLDDLENITSMGFRGEALASISAVSRLTVTSRTVAQSTAWQVQTEGRNLAISIKPVAHPVGTTVEVIDLFYNTPARRRFMRTEKTEFYYIDEVIRRIALARLEVTFILQHNGKIIRQYVAVNKVNSKQHLRRLGALCGIAFVNRAISIYFQHGNLSIHGWVIDPSSGNIPKIQYSYVNKRTTRNKLINHAVRQAYHNQLVGTQQPAFVLFLNVEPNLVNVNVHPTKNEVLFFKERLVHDFIYKSVMDVLQQKLYCKLPNTYELSIQKNNQKSSDNNFSIPICCSPSWKMSQKNNIKNNQSYHLMMYQNDNSFICLKSANNKKLSMDEDNKENIIHNTILDKNNVLSIKIISSINNNLNINNNCVDILFLNSKKKYIYQLLKTLLLRSFQSENREIVNNFCQPLLVGYNLLFSDYVSLCTDDAKNYDSSYGQSEKKKLALTNNVDNLIRYLFFKYDLVNSAIEYDSYKNNIPSSNVNNDILVDAKIADIDYFYNIDQVLTLLPPCYALIESRSRLAIISLPVADRYIIECQLITEINIRSNPPPLLIPIRVRLCYTEIMIIKHYQPLLQKIGIIVQIYIHHVILTAVPLILRKQNLQNLIPDLLGYLKFKTSVTQHQVIVWLARRQQKDSVNWSRSKAIQLVIKIKQFCSHVIKPPAGLMVKLNFESAIKYLNHALNNE